MELCCTVFIKRRFTLGRNKICGEMGSRMQPLFRRMRGVKLQHNKRTRLSETIEMPAPEFLTVPMKQHSGAPCEPVVKAGDYVYAGQIIGDSSAFVSVPVHSPVSGTVVGITEILTAGNEKIKCVRIQSDHRQILDPAIAPPVINNMEDFLKAVRDSGIVGLGGAGFPTHVKLAYKDIERVKTVYQSCRVRAYITADNREVFEKRQRDNRRIKLVLKYTGIPEAVVVVENNKPIGTQILSLHLSEIPNINIKVIGTKYPKGAEKSLSMRRAAR